MDNPRDDAELWHLDAPYGCGMVRTVGGMIIGGAPIFKKLRGWTLTKLPPSYKYEFIGVEPFESGAESRSWT